jgi:hypothetical protein
MGRDEIGKGWVGGVFFRVELETFRGCGEGGVVRCGVVWCGVVSCVVVWCQVCR